MSNGLPSLELTPTGDLFLTSPSCSPSDPPRLTLLAASCVAPPIPLPSSLMTPARPNVGSIAVDPSGASVAMTNEENTIAVASLSTASMRVLTAPASSAFTFAPVRNRQVVVAAPMSQAAPFLLDCAPSHGKIHCFRTSRSPPPAATTLSKDAARGVPHPHGVLDLCLSADGTVAVTAGQDGAALWSMGRAALKRTFPSPQRWCSSAAVSPDLKHIATCGPGHLLTLFDADTGREVSTPPPPGALDSSFESNARPHGRSVPGQGSHIRFGPRSSGFVAVLTPDRLEFVDCHERSIVQTPERTQRLGRPTCMAFSPDGLLIATGGHTKRRVQILDVVGGGAPIDPLLQAAASIDGSDARVSPMDTELGQSVSSIAASSVAFAPRGTTLVALSYDVVTVWHFARNVAEPPLHRPLFAPGVLISPTVVTRDVVRGAVAPFVPIDRLINGAVPLTQERHRVWETALLDRSGEVDLERSRSDENGESRCAASQPSTPLVKAVTGQGRVRSLPCGHESLASHLQSVASSILTRDSSMAEMPPK